ncbi:Chondroitin synthase [Gimesia panareensis]|uniref:Chondroitin synthase n=1 Tax=Gimesia panareensis TaxID=2527978 RepID=A0A518FTV8_9PLAN|nr:Chondroitin synthase [Gimesia panareensis]
MERIPVCATECSPAKTIRLFSPGSETKVYLLDLSVIIPTYNRADRLTKLLEAWLEVDAFTQLKYELIFSDDGSDDETLEILHSFQKMLPIRILKNEHAGPAEARNSGIAAASGHRVLFLGDDIYPAADLLDIHVSLGKRLGDHVAILGKVDWHPEQEHNHLIRHITEIGHEQFSYSVLPENHFTDYRHFYTCNVSVSNAMLSTETTMFDRRFYKANFEDIELAYRLSANGMKIYYAPAAYAHHYHEYDVERFSGRQETAGEMAQIFVDLHPEIDELLQLSEIEAQYNRYLKRNGIHEQPQTQLEQVLSCCKQYETDLKVNPGDLGKEKLLSLLYRQLFKFKFAAGVLSKADEFHKCTVDHFLYDRCFGYEFYNQLCSLQIENLSDDGKLTLPGLLQYYARLLKFKMVPSHLGKASELISNSLQEDVKNWAIRPDLKQMAKQKAKEYLRQYAVLRQLRQKARGLSMLRFKRKVAMEKPTESDIPRIAILSEDFISPSLIQDYQRELGKAVVFVRKTDRGFEYHSQGEMAVTPEISTIDFSYVLQVEDESEIPQIFHLKNVLVSLGCYWDEYLLLSHSYQPEPTVGVKSLPAQLFLKRNLYLSKEKETVRQGRVLRLLPAPNGVQEYQLHDLLADDSTKRGFLNRNLIFEPGQVPVKSVETLKVDFLNAPKDKPVVFVFPVFMAVGGAERNIIAVMNELQDQYHFVVVTMEKHSQRQGSLHHQVEEFTNDIYDLAEIASPDDFLKVLQALKQQYNPELLLITNGSPWLLSNTKQIRKLFAEIPIIDHQVYDQQAGWIEHYTDPGIQSFDRFVAINKKIQSVMEHDKGISQDRIRQIYHALDTERIRKFYQSRFDADAVCQKHGLPADRDKFIFLARLSSQKRPLEFLKMLKSLQDMGRREFFIMVGDGELKQDVDDFIRTAGLKNLIRIPFVNNPLELIAVSKGMIFTSAFEGLPVAMLEALSLGVPTFSTDVGDVRPVLEEYSAGMTIPVDCTTQDYVKYFNQFLVEREQYAASLEEGKKQIVDRFSAECIASQYGGLFRESMQLKKGA